MSLSQEVNKLSTASQTELKSLQSKATLYTEELEKSTAAKLKKAWPWLVGGLVPGLIVGGIIGHLL